jgi:hypothetical protein
VAPSRPPHDGLVNGSVSRDANVAFPLGWRFAPCPLSDDGTQHGPAGASVSAHTSLVEASPLEGLLPEHRRLRRGFPLILPGQVHEAYRRRVARALDRRRLRKGERGIAARSICRLLLRGF